MIAPTKIAKPVSSVCSRLTALASLVVAVARRRGRRRRGGVGACSRGGLGVKLANPQSRPCFLIVGGLYSVTALRKTTKKGWSLF